MASKSLIACVVAATLGSLVSGIANAATDQITCGNPVSEESVAACTRLIAHASLSGTDRFMAYYNRGWAYRRSGNNSQALADFDAAESRDRRYAKLYMSRALTNHDLGRLEAALEDLDRYVSLAPEDWRGYFERANLLREFQRYNGALKDLERASKLNRYAKEIGPAQVLTLIELGRLGSAWAEASRILAARKSDPAGRYVRAVISFRRGDLSAAIADLDVAIAGAPLFPAAYSLKAQILEVRSDIAAAQQNYEMALRPGGIALDSRTAQARAKYKLAEHAQSAWSTAAADSRNGSTDSGSAKRFATGSSGQCRRFIPAAAVTISVECGD
ncbi:MAG: tetratricopeptide repeat protein [Hyphomicrobiaceae bacterium]